ncbi:MAG: hypothetical protein GEV08_05205 [Acidimicrobiia bacterium]|nr:hypothetical protein [Acidimicrobiia bacterium]
MDVAAGPGQRRGRRGGVDAEGVISIDGGALRIRPLARPGWGRAALAYGPYTRQAGLSAAFVLLNSHHGSEHADPWPPLATYLKQIVRGTQVDPLPNRLVDRPRHHARETLARRLRSWRGHRGAAGDPDAGTNLAIGWLGSSTPTTATGGGQGLVVQSAHGENGDLLVEVAGERLLAQDRLQNLPLYVLAVLRERGATYWAASLPGAAGLPALPTLRPLGADVSGTAAELWAGVHQRVSGQVGWSIDTRVHEVRVARPEPWSSWWTTAHAADRPAGGRPRPGAKSAHGGAWRAEGDLVLLGPGARSGLVRLATDAAAGPIGIVLRGDGQGGHVLARLEAGVVTLERHDGGQARDRQVAEAPLAMEAQHTYDLQVVDDGCFVRVLLDGHLVLGPTELGTAPVTATEVGVWQPAGTTATVEELEAHPLELNLPAALAVGALPLREGTLEVFADDFTADGLEPRADLEGLASSAGGRWERSIGARAFTLGPDGVAVPPPPARPRHPLARAAALTRPGGERLAYTIAWDHPGLADLAVDISLPGTARHQGEGSRAGLLFWQDDDTYLMVNTWLDDAYDGTSISSFLRCNGYEDVFDAVWTNIGRRVTWGRPFRLRTVFDGELHTTWVDDEPVLYRRVSDVLPRAQRMRVTRVGILANWEFGQDTGSRFRRIRGRTRPSANLESDAADHLGR